MPTDFEHRLNADLQATRREMIAALNRELFEDGRTPWAVPPLTWRERMRGAWWRVRSYLGHVWHALCGRSCEEW